MGVVGDETAMAAADDVGAASGPVEDAEGRDQGSDQAPDRGEWTVDEEGYGYGV